MRTVRLSIVGFGVVGRWLAEAIQRRRAWLEAECDADVVIVAVANRRDGFIYREAGFDVPRLLDMSVSGRPLLEYPDSRQWTTAVDGLDATTCDVLAEASNTNPRDPEPALSHLKFALIRGTHVVTSSKGACAAAAVELIALARQRSVQFRMESTVMSGTPVLSTIREGLAGARVLEMRGILNGTANYILTLMSRGMDYSTSLASAQSQGFAEPDPADDVEGHDVVAKVRVLAAAAFGQSIDADQVTRRGIVGVSLDSVQQAMRDDKRLRLVATIRVKDGGGWPLAGSQFVEARVEPIALPLTDPLARVEGVMNALTIRTDTTSEVTIIGPGAGREQAGQGMFADLVAVLRGGI
ncbi:MAG TPA: homoserine dehydrogenase [Gemmatimonadaceae bacterium]|nr:homoserine dehydrogenase [Gemmatimonadaceae bacterium]